MVKIVLCLLFASLLYGSSCTKSGTSEILSTINDLSKSDSILLKKILELDKKRFIGSPVRDFLNNTIISKFSNTSFVDGKPAVLSFLQLIYSDYVTIRIHVNDYKFIQPYNPKFDWKIEEFEKESISEIEVLYNERSLQIVN